MTQEQIISICIIAGSFLIGVLVFFLAGIYHVKKDQVIVIEKVEKFYGLYYHGIYFFWPFVYRRRGTYNIKQNKKTIRMNNGNKAEFTYKVIDVMKYHYGGISIENLVNKLIISDEKVTLQILKKEFSNIGLELLNIK